MRIPAALTIVLCAALLLAGCADKPFAVSLLGDSTAVSLSKDVNIDDGEGAPSVGSEPVASGVGEDGIPLRNASRQRSTTSNQGNRAVYNVHYATSSSFEDLSRMLSKEGGGAMGFEVPIQTGEGSQETGGQDVTDESEAGDTDQGEADASGEGGE